MCSKLFKRVVFIVGLSLVSMAMLVALLYPSLPRKIYHKLTQMIWLPPEDSSHQTDKQSCSCSISAGRLPKDKYSKHRAEAKKLSHNTFIDDSIDRDQLRLKGDLQPIPSMMGLHIRALELSSKELHKNALPQMRELIDRFHNTCLARGIEGGELVISSVTRTADQQRHIRKNFPNAATKGTSAHSYGAAIDIVQVRSSKNCSKARQALFDVLRNMRGEGKLLLCPENRCLHVTFRV